MKLFLLALMVCAALAVFICMPGCSAQQVSDEVVTAQVALAPLKAQIATLPNGPAKAKMQKTLNRLEKGAADAAGWAVAVAELDNYFRELVDRLKAIRTPAVSGGAATVTGGAVPVSGVPPN